MVARSLQSDGMLKMFQFDANDKNCPKCEHFEIALNACDIDVLNIETKVKILIKYSTEHYVLFNIDEIDKSIELELEKYWQIDLEDSFVSSNISQMSYKNSDHVLFCCVLNVTNDQGKLIKQKLVYFDGEENEPIFVDIDQPLASETYIPRHPPLIQGNLSATRVFGCISQKCRLSAKFFEDDASGPIMTSFMSRDDSQLTLSPYKSASDVVLDDAEVVGYSKLDVLKDGNEEVVICSANGLTHILASNPNQEIIRYHHQKGIRFFTCGIVGTRPCFVYITSWNTVEIFSNVQLPYFNKRCILEAIGENEKISNYFKDKDATSKPAKLELLSQLVYS